MPKKNSTTLQMKIEPQTQAGQRSLKGSSKKKRTKSPKGGHGLSPLSEAYARSLANPFTGPVACIPDYPVVPSRKMKVYAKGVFETSATTGFGFLQYRPFAMPGNDVPAATYSTSTYTGSVTAISGTGVLTANSNSDYTGADFGTGTLANVRIVSAGVRIRYAGTELNRGGIAVGLQTPQHSLTNGLTFAQVDSAPQSARFRPKQGWISLCYCPVLVGEIGYYNTVTTNGVVTAGGGIMVFVITAPAGGTSVSYEFELHANLEVNGVQVRGLTPSASDPSGLAVVHTAANMTAMRPTDGPIETTEKSFLKRVEDIGIQTISSWGASLFDKIESGQAFDWLKDMGEAVMTLF